MQAPRENFTEKDVDTYSIHKLFKTSQTDESPKVYNASGLVIFVIGGDEENRTPVQKCCCSTFSERSRRKVSALPTSTTNPIKPSTLKFPRPTVLSNAVFPFLTSTLT